MAVQEKPTLKREITITRVFNAPRELVWRAWTDPEHLKHWWGPNQFTTPVCEMDVRPGGAIRIVMRGPDRADYLMIATFTEVVPIERLAWTGGPMDDAGNPHLDGLTTVTLADAGSKTKLTVYASAVGLTEASVYMIAGMETGWTQSVNRLEALVTADAGSVATVE